MGMDSDKFAQVEVRSAQELREWFDKYHNQDDSVWLVTYKKAVPEKYVTREQVLDELIAFGWIDGVRSQLDGETTMQLISPRKTRPWAKSYKLRAQRLIEQGLMQPAGFESIEIAKSNGGWDEMNDVDEMLIPDDLDRALKSQDAAFDNFMNFPPSVRRNILRWIASAKKSDTRAKRVELTAERREAMSGSTATASLV